MRAVPSRRSLLAGAVAVLASGCLGADHRCTHHVEIEAERVDLGAYLADASAGDDQQLTDAAAELARRVAEAGSLEVTSLGRVPDLDGERVEAGGAYYRIDQVDEAFTPVDALEAEFEDPCSTEGPTGGEPGDGGPGSTRPSDRALEYGELPAVDRRALRRAIDGGEYADPEARSCGDLWGTVELLYPDGLAESRLADLERVRIAWRDRTYRLLVTGEGTGRRYTARFEATEIAANEDEFRELLVEERGITALDGLSDAERAVMDEAVGYVASECLSDETPEAGVRGLLDELGTGGPTRVEYDGRLYEVTVRRRVAEL